MLKKWCEVTSCNGIIDLYQSTSSKWQFFFWAITMSVMLGASVWFTYQTANGYVETPTVTNIRTVTQSEVDFPDVLICYNGGLNVSAMKNEKFSDHLITAFSTSLLSNERRVDNTTIAEKELADYLTEKGIGIKELLINFSYKCEDIVAKFKSIWRVIPCTMAKAVMSERGKGYVYQNVGEQFFPGKIGGISIDLVRPQNSFYEMYPRIATEANMLGDFSIALEKSIEYQASHRSFFVPINVTAKITLNPKHYIRMASENQCNGSEKFTSSDTCFFSCFIEAAQKFCHCVPAAYWDETVVDPGTAVCHPLTDPCIERMGRPHDICQRYCLPKCDEWIYESTISYSFFDNNFVDIPKSVVSIAYNTLQYIEMKEVKSFTVDMAIANVGGQAGLWLGASAVTVVQALYYVALAIAEKVSLMIISFKKAKHITPTD